MDIIGDDKISGNEYGPCKHALFDLMIKVDKIYQFVGLKYCFKCRKVYKECLQELK